MADSSATAVGDPNLRKIPKIGDKIAARLAANPNKPTFSFEYFPPKTPEGVTNLYDRVERMAKVEPLFVDITWGAGGSTSDLTLDIAANIQKFLGVDVMMHLTCTNMPAGQVDEALQACKDRDIHNIVALRGDPPHGQEWQKCEDGFANADDLVDHIRKNYGNHFGIAVAGYPEGHPSGFLDGKITYDDEMRYLKQKVDKGADAIITQMFFDVDEFLKFVKRCRDDGITVPILPGILPVMSYNGWKRMVGFCKTKVPPEMSEALEAVKDDDAKVKEFGIRYGIDMCQRILKSGLVPGLHFYTLNLEKTVMTIIDGLGLINQPEAIRSLPWRPSTRGDRRSEDVRPIFWANRPKSYINRSASWDDFPNGRWGDNRSPAFKTVGDHHLFGTLKAKNTDTAETYGEVKSMADIIDVFYRFASGELNRLPWSEQAILSSETSLISMPLKWMNKAGLMTINSQPRINGAPSTDFVVGWGSAGGTVFQKAYLEFFCTNDLVERLFSAVENFPSMTIMAMQAASKEIRSNKDVLRTNAVTWGIFPDSEVVQPTVCDPVSFKVWKEEAFSIFNDVWGVLYPEESESRKALRDACDSLWLVNIVDNDFVAGDIYAFIKEALA